MSAGIALFAALDAAAEAADPPTDRVVAGTPRAIVAPLYESADGRVLAGTWTCSPGRWRIAYDETEYCRILAGRGALIGADGVVTPIAAGDEFVVPAGFAGEWLVEETMRKRYVVVLP